MNNEQYYVDLIGLGSMTESAFKPEVSLFD